MFDYLVQIELRIGMEEEQKGRNELGNKKKSTGDGYEDISVKLVKKLVVMFSILDTIGHLKKLNRILNP